MATRASRLLAIILTALALVPSGAHLMALPAKIGMPEQPYFVVQQTYRGWAWAGIAIFAAIFADFAGAFFGRGQARQSWLSVSAGLLIGLTLLVFFIWIDPANQATGNWTSIPDGWQRWRVQWEYSHAANAMITFVALLCSVGAALDTDVPQAAPVAPRMTV